MNIKQSNFSELMKKTVVTEDNQVKFLANGHDTVQSRFKKFTGSKVSSLWERRLNQNKASSEEGKDNKVDSEAY